jgi:hypothetical protein
MGAFVALVFVAIPITILTYIDLVHDRSSMLDRRPLIGAMVRGPVRLLGLASFALGAAICIWVPYNLFVRRLPQFRWNALEGLGLGPAMLAFGWWWLRGARGRTPRDSSTVLRTTAAAPGNESQVRFLVLLDEPYLFAFTSAYAAATAIEAIDVEEDFRAAFDDAGVPYRPEWLRANVRSRFFIQNGEYRFVPAGSPDPSALLALLAAHPQARDVGGHTVALDALVEKLRAG